MKKRKLKKSVKITILVVCLVSVLSLIYFIGTGKVNHNNETVTFEVTQGSSYQTLASALKENHLIKSEFFYKLYIKIHRPSSLQAGIYELSSSMNVKQLVNTLQKTAKAETISLTFKEGINFKDVIDIITQNMDITEDEIIEKITNSDYLDELINQYWFLTDDIKQDGIYYSLEGYLFPDTYNFNKDSSIEVIFKAMLDNTEKKLNSYQDQIEQNKYSIHEIMTMASIVELEASNSDDRAGVAGVFYNRLESGWSLGSDVTTYYGAKISLSERDLTVSELNAVNDYNTRSSSLAGKLPISPICMPSIESIAAAISPENHDYYYFVADKNGKTYFNKTSSGHTSTVAKLKSEGLWYEY
jgi:UPF0755 protein